MVHPNLLDFDAFKKSKKYKSIAKDLKALDKILYNTLLQLNAYKKYVPVKNTISSIMENKVYLNIYLKKIEKEIQNEDK